MTWKTLGFVGQLRYKQKNVGRQVGENNITKGIEQKKLQRNLCLGLRD